MNYLSPAIKYILVASLPFALTAASWAQAQPEQAQDSGTSTDLWIMPGSDFDRSGLSAKANYNIGIGHTFAFLKKDPIGDEVTFGYTYEDAGSGFWYSQFGADTESLGIMKNFGLPKIKWGLLAIPGFSSALQALPETPTFRTIFMTESP